jgi:tetratricopeptide (TPR) repeat protein
MTIDETLQTAIRLHQAGQTAQAEELYRRILEVDPKHRDAQHLLITLALQSNRHEIALDLARRAIAGNSAVPIYYFDLALILSAMKRWEEAIAAYQQLLGLQPKHAQGWNNLGILLTSLGRSEEAISAYRQALTLTPDAAEVINNLGNALHYQGRADEAIAMYQRVLTLNPKAGDVMTNMGVVQLKQGKVPEAIASFKRALKIQPTCYRTMTNLGVALFKLRRIGESSECFARALAINPNSHEALNGMGVIYQHAGRLDDSIACYRKAVALHPHYADALNNLSATLQLNGELDDAIAVSKRLLAFRPENPDAWSNLGYCLACKNQPKEAMAALRQALAFYANHKIAFYHLATLLAAEGELDQLMAEYQRVSAGDHPRWALLASPSPYIGDRIILLSCPLAIRDELRASGLCDWNLNAFNDSDVWLDPIASSAAISNETERIAALRAYIDDVSRNQAAMSGTICTIWMDAIPRDLAPTIRQAVGEDPLEIAAESAADVLRQIEPHTKPRPKPAGKVFAVCSIRNGGIELLPHWLEHYTKLGAERLLLGVFDDVSPALRDEIGRCANRWNFTCFSQAWNATGESSQELQRRSGCRLAGAVPETWILHMDLDEFAEFPAPIGEIVAAANAKGIDAVIGWLIDRVATDGSMPGIRTSPSLWEQFPIGCHLTAKVIRSGTQKTMLARYGVPVGSGHHYPSFAANLGVVPVGKAEQYRVHHFKWHGELPARIEWSLSQPNTNLVWRAEANRLMAWLNAGGGKINLADPTILARNLGNPV